CAFLSSLPTLRHLPLPLHDALPILPASFIVDGKVSLEALRRKFPDGHGRFTQYSMVGIVDPQQIAEISNEVQRYFVEQTRLGIPDRKSTRLNSSHVSISYAVFCLKQ